MAEQNTRKACPKLDLENPENQIRLTCLKCGRFAAVLGISGEVYIEMNCKTFTCQIVNCYHVKRDGSQCKVVSHSVKPKPVQIKY